LGNGKTPTHADIRDLLAKVESLGFEWIKLENLYMFDGVKAYSMGQGE
jgi:isocitrate dehydrogenase